MMTRWYIAQCRFAEFGIDYEMRLIMSEVVREEVSSVCMTRRPGCQVWYLCFRVKRHYANGASKWANKWQSTKTRDEEEARRRWLDPARDVIQNKNRAEAMRSMMEVVAGSSTMGVRVPLADLWDYYVAHATVSGGTRQVRDRKAKLTYFLQWLAGAHPEITFLREVTIRLAAEFWKWMEEDGKAPRTRNTYRAQLSVVWQGVTMSAELELNPWTKLDTDKAGGESYQDFTPTQIRRLCEAADAYESRWPGFWPVAIRMGAETGLRQGDIATLQADEIQRDIGYLVLVPNKTRRWGKDRVSVHSLDRPWAGMLPDVAEGQFWPEVASASRMGKGAIGLEFREICQRAGIVVERPPLPEERRKKPVKLYTFHSLRHGFATMALETGKISEGDLVAQGNWSGEEIIKGTYDHRDKLKQAMKAADKVAAALRKW
jgi:integrase